MQKSFFESRFQIILWMITTISICLNAYLITSKVTSNEDPVQVEDYEEDFVEVTQVQAPPTRQWTFGSDGIISIEINKLDTLEALLASANLKQDKVVKILDSIRNSAQLTTIRAGTRIQIQLSETAKNNEPNDPKKITIFLDTHKVETAYNNTVNAFETKRIKLPLEWQVKIVSGTVNGSLFSSARRAGADPTIVSQLINLFSYDIDFQRDIHPGDTFRILYEFQTDYRGKIVKNAKILYANINANNKARELYRHTIASNSVEYYDKKGNSIKRSLLKTPINGAKITSNFGFRTHPVLGYSRMHQGLDYGAPRGTPVLAAGDGTIIFAKSLSRGYGKHIQIKHNDSYATLYGHLSRFANNISAGSKIKQGQVIGYVGDTGLASGPHLHYEVIINGKKVNPAKVKAPKFFPLQGKELAKFKDNIKKLDQMVAELDDKKGSKVALNFMPNRQ